MKKIFYFMSLAAVVFAMASCKDKKEEPVPQDEKVIPQQIRLADAFQEYFMSEGETALIQYTMSPTRSRGPLPTRKSSKWTAKVR